jgi:hypothetical protein
MNYQVPHIQNELDQSLEALTDLSETLPTIQSQVTNIRKVYDSGRQKVCALFRRAIVEKALTIHTGRLAHWSLISNG